MSESVRSMRIEPDHEMSAEAESIVNMETNWNDLELSNWKIPRIDSNI
jgi:hypothetical protein